ESEAAAPLKGTVMPTPVGNGAKAPLALEIADDPCWVILSTSGQLARTTGQDPITDGGQRVKHDAFTSVVATTARAEIGALTSSGRMLRLQVVDMPALPPTNGIPNLAGGVSIKEFITLERGESLVGLVPLDRSFALGTAQGVVKRVVPEYPLNRDDWEAITLKPRDAVVGLAPAEDADDLVFITREAQLLRFPAAAVRPQGRMAGGVAGIKLAADDVVVSFGAVRAEDPAAVVVTIAAGSGALPGTSPGSVKVTEFSEYPVKGRATGGVRCHRFLKGEDHLALAWVGHGPARAVSSNGVARALPTEHGRRDGSGVALSQPVDAIGPAPQ
ncbi:MAG: DNA gyrase C-terminal beta-propeller domain-containing protein, partial [Actinomycetes bacterium]